MVLPQILMLRLILHFHQKSLNRV